MTEPGIRHVRIEELLLEEMETIIPFEMSDPRVVGCQVTRVQLAADMKYCRVFVINPGDTEIAEPLAVLNRAASFIRGRIQENLALKFTPKFEFFHDGNFEKAQKLESIFRSLHQSAPDAPPAADEQEVAGTDGDSGAEETAGTKEGNGTEHSGRKPHPPVE